MLRNVLFNDGQQYTGANLSRLQTLFVLTVSYPVQEECTCFCVLLQEEKTTIVLYLLFGTKIITDYETSSVYWVEIS